MISVRIVTQSITVVRVSGERQVKKVCFSSSRRIDSLKTSLKSHCCLFCQMGVKSGILSKAFASILGK